MRKLIPLAALAAFAVAAPAAAQWDNRWPGYGERRLENIEWRLDRIYERIEDARRRGRISPEEARALHGEGRRIADLYNRFRYGGVNREEARELAGRTRALREEIRSEMRDRWDWDDGRDGYELRRDDEWGDERRWSDEWDESDWRGDDRRDDGGDWRTEDRREEGRAEDSRDDRWGAPADDRWGDRPEEERWSPDTDGIAPERWERIEPFDPGSAVDPEDDRWFYGDAPQRD